MNRQYGQRIGEFLGKVLEVNAEMDNTGWGHFFMYAYRDQFYKKLGKRKVH